MTKNRAHKPTMRWLWLMAASLALVLCLMPQPASAQAVTGTILGTVKDSSGAVVVGAKVKLTQIEMGMTREVVSDARGEYTAPMLPTGTYNIVCEMTGFKGVTLANVRLRVDQKVRMDLTLEVGVVTDAITIQADTPLISTNTSDLSATINETQIKTLPITNRNFVFLARTIPGVGRGTAGDNIDGSAGSYGWRNTAAFTANGQRTRDNNFMLDGVDNNEQWLNTVVIFPNVDALEEFKVQTSTYSAEFGKSLGGVVNLQTKSGTNAFHGSAYEFLRNDKLDANDWFNNKFGRARPDFSQHQFGGTLSGPLIQNKTFFFADYQGWRANQDLTMISTVPTARMRQGDFSELNRAIYDPFSPGTQFAGNVLPTDRMDAAALRILGLYPAPNADGSKAASGQTINNYISNPTMERRDNQADLKIDHILSPRNRMFARLSYEKSYRLLPGALPDHGDAGSNVAGVGSAGIGNIKAWSLALNDTHSFSDKLINEFRLGWNSIEINAEPIDYRSNAAQAMGVPGINLSEVSSSMMMVSFTGGSGIRNIGPTSSQPLFSNSGAIHLTDSLTYVKGGHTLKAGASVMFLKREVLNAELATSQALFSYNLTSNCAGIPSGCTLDTNTGFDLASFLLGYPASWQRRLYESAYTERRPYIGAFIQDDWRVSNKLTLNLGVRWEVYVPFTTDDDKQSNFDPKTGKFVVASPDAVIYPSATATDPIKVGRYLQTYSKGDFAPRFGFAYDAFGKGRTVLRGGFGIFYNNSLTGTSSSKAQNPPFLLNQSYNYTYVPGLRLSGGLPALPIVDPSAPATGDTRSLFDPNFRDSKAYQWNLNVQQQLGKNYMIEVGYIGSRGRNLIVRRDLNQPQPTLGVTDPKTIRPYYTISPGLVRLSSSFADGKNQYDALHVRFNRRFTNGFSFSTSYTYGKAQDYDSSTDGWESFNNSYDYEYNWGPAAYDIRHSFNANWVYELPFGRNHKLGGWQISGILFIRSGYALTVGQTQGVQSTGKGNRPDQIGSGAIDDPTIDKWFDTRFCRFDAANPNWRDPGACSFAEPQDKTATYGNAPKGSLRGPGQTTLDLALVKVTRFGRVEHELRVEAFNALNHPTFGNPNTTLGSATVGQITSLLPLTPMRQIQLSMKLRF
jgi:hypothetical protein